jgi:hypothetical protein
MAGKATKVNLPSYGRNLGKFHIQRFNIINADDRMQYERIRTLGSQPGSGIVIDHMKDLNEVEEHRDVEGNVDRIERWYIVVSWWENEDLTKKAESPPDTKSGFYKPIIAEG